MFRFLVPVPLEIDSHLEVMGNLLKFRFDFQFEMVHLHIRQTGSQPDVGRRRISASFPSDFRVGDSGDV